MKIDIEKLTNEELKNLQNSIKKEQKQRKNKIEELQEKNKKLQEKNEYFEEFFKQLLEKSQFKNLVISYKKEDINLLINNIIDKAKTPQSYNPY